MRRELFSIIFFALVEIFLLFIDADTNTIFNIIIVFVITVIDGIYIYVTHHIDIEKRSEKLRIVHITGISLMAISALLAIIEAMVLIKKWGIFGVVSKVSGGSYSYCWQFILSAVLVYQVYKAMRCFSKSLTAQNTTDWFYEKEDNQEEK